MENPEVMELLPLVQNELNGTMKSIQTAIMWLDTAGDGFSETLSALRETHRLLFRLDLAIGKVSRRWEVSL